MTSKTVLPTLFTRCVSVGLVGSRRHRARSPLLRLRHRLAQRLLRRGRGAQPDRGVVVGVDVHEGALAGFQRDPEGLNEVVLENGLVIGFVFDRHDRVLRRRRHREQRREEQHRDSSWTEVTRVEEVRSSCSLHDPHLAFGGPLQDRSGVLDIGDLSVRAGRRRDPRCRTPRPRNARLRRPRRPVRARRER